MRTNAARGLTVALCLAATACGAAATPSPSTATPSPRPAGAITATESANERTIMVHVGDRLSVVLHSTYWTITGSSSSAIMRVEGQPKVAPSPSGCVPGEGCGTVTGVFDALAVGTVQITASRTTCGEALLCSASTGTYRLTVVVQSKANA